MPDPSTIDTPVNVWTPIATDVLQGFVVKVNDSPDAYYFTTRPAGSAVPPITDPDDQAFLGVHEFIDDNIIEMGFIEPTDVYILCHGSPGRVLFAPYAIESLKGITGSNMVTSIPEDFMARGKAFTYQDYLFYAADEIKNFIFDPTGYAPPPGSQQRVVGFFPSIFAEAGPVKVDFFADPTEAGDGAPLVIFNRDATSLQAPASTLKLNPSVISDDGARFTGIGVPANSVGSGQAVSSSVEDSLPLALDIDLKYLIRVENTNGANTMIMMRFTFFEI